MTGSVATSTVVSMVSHVTCVYQRRACLFFSLRSTPTCADLRLAPCHWHISAYLPRLGMIAALRLAEPLASHSDIITMTKVVTWVAGVAISSLRLRMILPRARQLSIGSIRLHWSRPSHVHWRCLALCWGGLWQLYSCTWLAV